jgi:hypothetical protein
MGNLGRDSKEFRERGIRRMKLGDNVSQLARELGVHRTCPYAWKRQLGHRHYSHGRGLEPDWRECLYFEIRSRMRSQGQLSIKHVCELAGVSRASLYRHWETQGPVAAETELRGVVQC